MTILLPLGFPFRTKNDRTLGYNKIEKIKIFTLIANNIIFLTSLSLSFSLRLFDKPKRNKEENWKRNASTRAKVTYSHESVKLVRSFNFPVQILFNLRIPPKSPLFLPHPPYIILVVFKSDREGDVCEGKTIKDPREIMKKNKCNFLETVRGFSITDFRFVLILHKQVLACDIKMVIKLIFDNW